jgi:Peptidase family M49
MIRIRDIVLANKVPRRIELQPNLFHNPETNTVEYKGYDSTFQGVIRSYVERFSNKEIGPVYNEFMANQERMRN